MSDHVKEKEEQVAKTEEEKQVTKTEEEQEPTGKNETEYNDPNSRELPGTSKSFTPQLQMKLKLEDDSKKNTNEETPKDHYSPDGDIPFIDNSSAYTVSPTPTSDKSLATGYSASPSDDTTASHFSPDEDTNSINESSTSHHQYSYQRMSSSDDTNADDISLDDESSAARSTTAASSSSNGESTYSRITSIDSGICTLTESTAVEADISDMDTDDNV